MIYQSNPVQPNQKYIEAYDKLSKKKKQKFFESKVVDKKALFSMLNLFNMRNLGFKEYINKAMEKNHILKEIIIFRIIARIVLFFHFHKVKMGYIWNIVEKGYTPKGVYFHYAVLSDETLDCKAKDSNE